MVAIAVLTIMHHMRHDAHDDDEGSHTESERGMDDIEVPLET